MKVSEIKNFEELMSQAELNAKGDWEIEFTGNIRTKSIRCKDSFNLSEKQIERLEKISGIKAEFTQ